MKGLVVGGVGPGVNPVDPVVVVVPTVVVVELCEVVVVELCEVVVVGVVVVV